MDLSKHQYYIYAISPKNDFLSAMSLLSVLGTGHPSIQREDMDPAVRIDLGRLVHNRNEGGLNNFDRNLGSSMTPFFALSIFPGHVFWIAFSKRGPTKRPNKYAFKLSTLQA